MFEEEAMTLVGMATLMRWRSIKAPAWIGHGVAVQVRMPLEVTREKRARPAEKVEQMAAERKLETSP